MRLTIRSQLEHFSEPILGEEEEEEEEDGEEDNNDGGEQDTHDGVPFVRTVSAWTRRST